MPSSVWGEFFERRQGTYTTYEESILNFPWQDDDDEEPEEQEDPVEITENRQVFSMPNAWQIVADMTRNSPVVNPFPNTFHSGRGTTNRPHVVRDTHSNLISDVVENPKINPLKPILKVCLKCNSDTAPEQISHVNTDDFGSGYCLCKVCADIYFLCIRCKALRAKYSKFQDQEKPVFPEFDGWCNRCTEDSFSRVIYRYDERPEFYLHGSGGPGVGVELEVESVDGHSMFRDAYLWQRELNNSPDKPKRDEFLMKHDGSLTNGFELVTHPMTKEYHEKFWIKALKARPHGLKAWTQKQCGLHIHIARSYWDKDKQDYIFISAQAIARMRAFFANPRNRGFISLMSGRKENIYCNRRQYLYNHPTQELRFNESRRVALNCSNDHTIEFRIFRATFLYTRILANIEFCLALIKFSEQNAMTFSHWEQTQDEPSEKYYHDWYSFAAYVLNGDNRNLYPNLTPYVNRFFLSKSPEG